MASESNSSLLFFLRWFQTSLPHCRYQAMCRVITACRFRVAASSGHTLSSSGIASKLNRIQLSAICHCGQSGEDIDWLVRRCLSLGLPLRQVAFGQLYKYHQQSGNAASDKLVWKHKAWGPNLVATFGGQPHKQASAQGHNNNSNNKA